MASVLPDDVVHESALQETALQESALQETALAADAFAPTCLISDALLWHYRLGHPGVAALRAMKHQHPALLDKLKFADLDCEFLSIKFNPKPTHR